MWIGLKKLLLVLLVLAGTASLCSAGTHNALNVRRSQFVDDGNIRRAQAVSVTVNTAGFSFVPPVIAVPAGTEVVWQDPAVNGVNDICHTVTTAASLQNAAGGRDNLDPNNPDSFDQPLCNFLGFNTVSHIFTTPGIYYYFCRPHAQFGMVGAVVVGP